MRHPYSRYYSGAALLLFMAAAILLLPWLGLTDFNSKGEPREAIVAVSMLQSGDWILPVSSGQDIPFKPPFMAWLIAAFSWLFNGGIVSVYLSRLPSALAGIALTMTSYAWASKIRGQRFGLIMGLVVLTSIEVYRAADACRNDMLLTACMVGALYLLYDLHEDYKRPGRFWCWLATIILLSCAVLTKGPVGALLPCFVAGAYYVFRGDSFFPTFFKMIGLALAAMLIPALWYYAAWTRGGERFFQLMYEENIQRLTSTMGYSSHVKPIWYNFVTIIAGMCPWTLAALLALFSIRKWHWSPLKPAGMFAVTAVVLVVGFYCIPESKRSVYLLPAYPFIAYGVASILAEYEAWRPVRAYAWIIAVLGIAAPITFGVLQFFPVDKLTLTPIPWWGYIMLLIPIGASIQWMRHHGDTAVNVGLIVGSLLLAYSSTVKPSVLNPKSDIRVVDRLKESGARVLTLEYEPGYRLFTLNFYLDDKIRPVASIEEAGRYPSGTLMLVSERSDTTGLYKNFIYEDLLPRSCDHREKVGLAVRK